MYGMAIVNVWFSVVNDQCVLLLPPTSKRSSDHLLPHGDPDMIGGFRVARRCVAGMESRYGLVFTKSSSLSKT